MNKAKIFKQFVCDDEILILPCCHDGISAKVLEEAGFKAIAMAGYGTSGSILGKPDIGLLSGMELLNQYKNICNTVNIPVFVDIDTGYGDVNNVIRIVKECEKIGAAGLFIEDQVWPKRCGHMAGKHVVSIDEYLPKLKAALDARVNPDFVIMARTDAAAELGIEEALKRAEIYADAGADMLFVEAVNSKEEMRRVNNLAKRLNKPSMANMVEGGRTPLLSAEELQELGYSVVAYPCSTVYTVVRALRDMAQHLKRNGSTIGYLEKMINFDEYYKFIGTDEIREKEKEFYK